LHNHRDQELAEDGRPQKQRAMEAINKKSDVNPMVCQEIKSPPRNETSLLPRDESKDSSLDSSSSTGKKRKREDPKQEMDRGSYTTSSFQHDEGVAPDRSSSASNKRRRG
jgi:hypothetical protein